MHAPMTAAASTAASSRFSGRREREETHGGYRGHARGQAVEPVDEVDHVRETHQVDHGDGHGEQPEQNKAATGRTPDVVDPQARRNYETRGGDLAEQLDPPGQIDDVVDHTHEKDEPHAGGHTGQRDAAVGFEQAALPTQTRLAVHLQRDRRCNAGEDRHAAQPGYGHGVHPAPAGLVDKTAASSEGAHGRRDQERHQRRSEYEHRVVSRAHGLPPASACPTETGRGTTPASASSSSDSGSG